MDWELIQALKIKCLEESINPTPESRLRSIFRWYSTTFHTPLHTVEDLPLAHIFETFFDEMFARMSPEDIEDEIRLLTMTEAERRQAENEEAEEEADALEFLRKIQKESTPKPDPEISEFELELEEFDISFEDE